MSIYKRIQQSDISSVPIQTHKTFDLNTGSAGLQSIQFRSGSSNLSGSYWSSLQVNFYLSGSSLNREDVKFANPYHSRIMDNPINKQHKNKFFSSGSVISIPQQYFGEEILQGSFQLIDNSTSKEITIQDDGFGNLFAVGNTISSSTNSPSSSDNYVGNIFYKNGVVVLTETSSYSHTPSSGSIRVSSDPIVSGGPKAGANHFFITGSDLTTSIKFISTGSHASETDTNSVKFFASSSNLNITALSASKKINDVFNNTHITASTSASVIQLTNNANLLFGRKPSTDLDNLPLISATGSFVTSSGFGGGVAHTKYTDVSTKNYKVKFKSTQTIFVNEYTVKVNPNEFNVTNNPTATVDVNGNNTLRASLTSSKFTPFMNTIGFYGENDSRPVMIARYPQPIKIRDDVTIIFKIRQDF